MIRRVIRVMSSFTNVFVLCICCRRAGGQADEGMRFGEMAIASGERSMQLRTAVREEVHTLTGKVE